tara:strand:+ start:1543 stop:2001 length:459 start_codon:yes stop_codon:yes gene_type:complete
MRETDFAWVAGLIDGEGCLRIHKRKPTKNRGYNYNYQARVSVKMTHLPTIERLREIFPFGCVVKEHPGKLNKRVAWRWEVTTSNAEKVLRSVRSYLVTKKEEADKLLEYISYEKEKSGSFPKRLGVPEEISLMRENFFQEMKKLKQYDYTER